MIITEIYPFINNLLIVTNEKFYLYNNEFNIIKYDNNELITDYNIPIDKNEENILHLSVFNYDNVILMTNKKLYILDEDGNIIKSTLMGNILTLISIFITKNFIYIIIKEDEIYNKLIVYDYDFEIYYYGISNYFDSYNNMDINNITHNIMINYNIGKNNSIIKMFNITLCIDNIYSRYYIIDDNIICLFNNEKIRIFEYDNNTKEIKEQTIDISLYNFDVIHLCILDDYIIIYNNNNNDISDNKITIYEINMFYEICNCLIENKPNGLIFIDTKTNYKFKFAD